MSEVIVERQWDPPLGESDLWQMFSESGDCLMRHRCDWRSSLLSADGRDLFCHFGCPDAESLRLALHQAGSQPGRVWSGTVHEVPGCTEADVARANVLVCRRFEQPVTFEAIQALEDAVPGCLRLHRVRPLRSFFAADRRRMLCLYEAPDAESARLAQRLAGMPVERVLAVRRFGR